VCASDRFSSLHRNNAAPLLDVVPSPYLWRTVRPVRHQAYSLHMYWPCYKYSLGREQNSGRKGGSSFHIGYTVSCQGCLLLVPTCGDVVLCQLDRMWCMWWPGRRASCLSTTDLEGEKDFILSSIGGSNFRLYVRVLFDRLRSCVCVLPIGRSGVVTICLTVWNFQLQMYQGFRTVRYVSH